MVAIFSNILLAISVSQTGLSPFKVTFNGTFLYYCSKYSMDVKIASEGLSDKTQVRY